MNEKVLLVVNPVAGKGRIKKDIKKIKQNLENSKFYVDIKYTTLENNAEEIVKSNIKDKDIILAVGGDGTLNEIVNGVTKSNKQVKVGFIPLGTTNDFARTLNVPTDKFELSKHILNAKGQKCDTGIFNGKCFNYVSAFGTFTKASYETDRKMKQTIGRLAYLASGTRDFLKEENNYHLRIIADDQIIEDDFSYGSISNSNYIGGFKMFKEDEVNVNDGKFEVLLIKKTKNKAELLKTYTKLINQKRDDNVIYFKTSKLKIETEKSMKWSLDGEMEESNGIVEIKNLEHNINFLTM